MLNAMREPQHIFGQIPSPEGVQQVARLDGHPQIRRHHFEAPWSQVPAMGVERAQKAVGRVLRWSARSIYLSPILLLLRFGPRVVGDTGLLIAIALGLIFFSVLNVFIVLTFLSFRSKKKHPLTQRFRTPFSHDGRDTLGVLRKATSPADRMGIGQRIRVRGVVRGLSEVPRGAPVVCDHWWTDEGARLTEVVDFLVEGDRTVVVQCEAAPLIIAEPKAMPLMPIGQPTVELLPTQQLPSSPGQHVVLCEGDEVELVGRLQAIVDNILSLGPSQAAAPYRGGDPREGLLVRSTFEHPVCIQVTRARLA